MPRIEETARLYENLALLFDQQQEPRMRDWFLVLAADAALAAGNAIEAERLRGLLLARNPHHLISPFASFTEALKSPDIQAYVADLRREYPPAVAGKIWEEHKSPEPTLEFDAEEMTPAAHVPVTGPEEPLEADREPLFAASSEAPAGDLAHADLVPLLPDPDREPEAYRLQSESSTPAPAPLSPPPPRLHNPLSPSLPSPPRNSEKGTAGKTVTVVPATPTSLPLEPAAPPPPPKKAATFPGYELLPSKPARSARTEDDIDPASRWVAGLLTGLAGLLGLAWLLYGVARPFLPPAWFR